MKKVSFLVVLVLILSTLALSSAMAGIRYDAISMAGFWPTAINNRGQVAGNMYGPGGQIAIWYQGHVTLVSVRGYKFTAVIDINDAGTLLLSSPRPKGGNDYYLVRGNARRVTLPTGATAQALNSANQVAGIIHDSRANTQRGFIWQDGQITFLTEAKHGYCWIVGMNNLGQVTGITWGMGDGEHPFIWSEGRLTFMETPGGDGRSYDINGYGQVSGYYSPFEGYDQYGQPVPSYLQYAVVWKPNGQIQFLNSNGLEGTAVGISTVGVVAGALIDPYGGGTVIWQDNSQPISLPGLLNIPLRPFGTGMHINDAGQIICYDWPLGYFFLQPHLER